MPLPTDLEIIDKAQQEASDLGSPRCAFIEKALSLAGLAYADAGTRDQYVAEVFLEGIFEKNTDGTYKASQSQIAAAYQMAAAMSACGIVTAQIWNYAGVAAPYLKKFYAEPSRMGSAVGAEFKFATSVGAWVSGMPWRRGTPFPVAGDALIIGNNTSEMARGDSGNYQHEMTCIAWVEGPQGALMASLDGGQPGIALRTRGLVEVFPDGGDEGELWCSKVAPDGSLPITSDGRPASGRRVVGYTDVSKLPFRDGSPPSCKGGPGWKRLALAALGVVALGAAAVQVAPWVARRI